jgi:hypothetical protein
MIDYETAKTALQLVEFFLNNNRDYDLRVQENKEGVVEYRLVIKGAACFPE